MIDTPRRMCFRSNIRDTREGFELADRFHQQKVVILMKFRREFRWITREDSARHPLKYRLKIGGILLQKEQG